MTEANSFKNYVFGTFIGHEASTLHNAIIILLGDAMWLLGNVAENKKNSYGFTKIHL